MDLSSLNCNGTLSTGVAPGKAGVIGSFRVGIQGLASIIPTDSNQFGVRDITFAASASHTLNIDDFHIDAEGDAWTDADGDDINIVTLYGVFFYILSWDATGFVIDIDSTKSLLNSLNDRYHNTFILGRAAGAITYVLAETGTTQGGVVRCMAIGKDS